MSNRGNRAGRFGHQRRDQQGQQHHRPSPLDLPGYPSYLKDSKLEPAYLDEYARGIAAVFGDVKLTKSQMRGFFGDVKRLETRFRATKNFDTAKERLLQLKAMAYERRHKNKVPPEFQKFIEKNVDKILDETTLDAFVKHFEAVVAYSEGRLIQR